MSAKPWTIARRFYRRSALRESDAYIEIWTEKDALARHLIRSRQYLRPAGGFQPRYPFDLATANQLREHSGCFLTPGRDVFVYQFGDHDPTGCLIPKHIERQIGGMVRGRRLRLTDGRARRPY